MDKSFIEELREAKHEYDTVLVNFFNDGKTRTDERYMYKYLEKADKSDEFYLITETMKDTTKMYSHGYDFDTIKMNLLLGLIYDANDVDENKQIKENTNPVDGVIRFYTGEVHSYLDDEKTNKYVYDYGRQGFIKFDKLMSNIKKTGLEYDGPESFEELKERILNEEVFDITLSANLEKKEQKEEQVVEPIVEEVKEKPKSKIKTIFGL